MIAEAFYALGDHLHPWEDASPTLRAAYQLLTPDPVGPPEIAARLGVSPRTVEQWRYRHQLPPPTWTISGRPAWNWPDIHTWHTNRH